MNPVFSAIGMNSEGETRPRLGCCHRTRASNPATRCVVQGDHRLEEEHELASGECFREVGIQLEFGLRRPQDGGVEDLAPAPAEQPRPVQGRVGIAHHGLGLGVTGGAHGDADAGREKDLVATDHERRQEFAEHAIRDDSGIADLGESVEQDGELVSAQPRHQVVAAHAGAAVAGAQAGLEPPGRGGQQRVWRPGAGLIFMRIRPAEVDEEHREVVRRVPS